MSVVPLTDGKRSLPVITTSELRTFVSCKRKHRIQYRDLIRPIDRGHALAFGTAFHALREAIFNTWRVLPGDAGAALSIVLSTMAKLATAAPGETEHIDEYERVKLLELARGYVLRWHKEPIEILAVEIGFEIPIVNPDTGRASQTFRLSGKVDAVVRDTRSQRVLVNELKTSSEDVAPGGAYWKRLRMDPQVSNYFEGVRGAGFHDVAACQYDVVRKPALRPLKATPEADRKYTVEKPAKPCPPKKCSGQAGPCELCGGKGMIPGEPSRLYAAQRETDETPAEYGARLREDIANNPDSYFSRGEVVRMAEEEEEHARDLWAVAKEIRSAERGAAPRNPYACQLPGRECPYFAACTGETTLDNPEKYRRALVAHEELAAA